MNDVMSNCEVKEWSGLVRVHGLFFVPTDKVPQDENKTKSSHSNRQFLCDSCQLVLSLLSLLLWSRCSLQLHCYFVLNHFVSVDTLFALLFWFKSCQINSHSKLI